MSGEKDLKTLLKNMSPTLNNEEYIFLSLKGGYGEYKHLEPLCSFQEKEGLTLIIPERIAKKNSIKYEEVYKVITLEVHSSLEAVGLTAAVASKLSKDSISANIVAAFHHDHIFIPAQFADKALKSLKELTG